MATSLSYNSSLPSITKERLSNYTFVMGLFNIFIFKLNYMIIKDVQCPHCHSVLEPLVETEEFYCGECNEVISRVQLIGIIFASGASERVTDEDLAQERSFFAKETNLHYIMQAESIDNLAHELNMRSMLGAKERRVLCLK